MPNNDYANEPNQSRSEDIIQSILDNTEYDEPARSRIEYLLIELKNAIEGGGGGGGVTSYSPLTEKPKIDNHTLQAGNNSSSDLGLQTKLTFDSAPTESSTNPVTSGGVYTALGTKANSSDVYNKSDVDTALTAKADKSTTYTKSDVDTALSSKQNTISDLSTIRSGAALGATAVQPETGKGLSTNDYTTAEKEKLAGVEAQANKTTVDSALSGSSTNPVQNKVVKSALDGKQATLTTAQLAAVNSGITAEKLTQDENNILLITPALVECVDNGAKNLLNFSGSTIGTPPDCTMTDAGDGTFIVTKTSTTLDIPYIDVQIKAGTYVYSGCPAGGSDSTYRLDIRTTTNAIVATDYGNGVTVTIPSDGTYRITCRLDSTYTTTGIIIKPMLCDPVLWAISHAFKPYAMNNAEITAWIQLN